MTTFGCDEFRELAPDLALGLLAGDERAAAINHVVGCASCRRHLNALVQVADELLLLAPSVEPDIGFESRVMARLATEGAFAPATSMAGPSAAVAAPAPEGVPAAPVPQPAPSLGVATNDSSIGTPDEMGANAPVAPVVPLAPRRGARIRPWPVGIAAAVAVLVGVTSWATGWSGGHDAGRASALSHSQLTARTAVVWGDGGKSWCNLSAFPGHGTTPAQLVVQLDEPGQPDESYRVMALPVDGSPAVLLGTINVVDGQGTFTASIPPGTGRVNAIQVLEGPSIKYRATFAAI